MYKILFICMLGILTLSEEPYKKIINNIDPYAKCLDGTSPAIYLHEGGDTKNFLIFFEGGYYCRGQSVAEVIESCYQRSHTDLGSSARLPDYMQSQGGYMSSDPKVSRFATWTKIFVRYCDGSLHQGSNADPIQYKDTQLYFRGANNVRAHFKWLMKNYDFVNAKKVLLTGASAGGIATFFWTNYVRDLLADPYALYTVPDSGTFMNVTSPITGKNFFDVPAQYLYKVANTHEKTPINICNRAFQGEQYKCFFMERAFTSLLGRVLILNSEYDAIAYEDMGIKCTQKGSFGGFTFKGCNETQMGYIESYRAAFMKFVGHFMQFSKNSIWTIACCAHSYACYGSRYDVDGVRVPGVTGMTVKDAVERFVFDEDRVQAIDINAWPNNAPCAY